MCEVSSRGHNNVWTVDRAPGAASAAAGAPCCSLGSALCKLLILLFKYEADRAGKVSNGTILTKLYCMRRTYLGYQ